ncbi:Pectinesterase inhibitor domain [Dillenia turbinata]|uniref:Pectinesterase inhibitor domain n=1 Tax=Dillenia turbinata TaxID=194707 RepID=A0AAN8VSK2_9MAGN
MKYTLPFIFTLFCSLLLVQCFARSPLIDQLCRKASQGSIIVKYSFCVSSFANDPRSKRAKSIEEVGGITIQHSISYGNRIQTDIARQLKNPKLSTDFRIAFQSCFTYYSHAIPKLESAFNSFRSRDYPTAHQNLVSAMDASTDCQDAFDEVLPEENHTYTVQKNEVHSPLHALFFCISSLENDFKCERAKSIEELGGIAIEHSILYGSRVQTDIASHLNDPKLSTDSRIAFQSCFKYYSDALPRLESALNSFRSRDYRTARQNLVSAMDAPTDCHIAFAGIGPPKFVTRHNSDFFYLTAIPYALT